MMYMDDTGSLGDHVGHVESFPFSPEKTGREKLNQVRSFTVIQQQSQDLNPGPLNLYSIASC